MVVDSLHLGPDQIRLRSLFVVYFILKHFSILIALKIAHHQGQYQCETEHFGSFDLIPTTELFQKSLLTFYWWYLPMQILWVLFVQVFVSEVLASSTMEVNVFVLLCCSVVKNYPVLVVRVKVHTSTNHLHVLLFFLILGESTI